jgi:hypothetical protein
MVKKSFVCLKYLKQICLLLLFVPITFTQLSAQEENDDWKDVVKRVEQTYQDGNLSIAKMMLSERCIQKLNRKEDKRWRKLLELWIG